MDSATKRGATDLDGFKAVVIGASAGGIDALSEILPRLPKNYSLPIIVVLHIPGDKPSLLAEVFRSKIELRVKDADEKEKIQPGTVYFASPGYHLLVERDLTFSLSTEEPVHFARPSIDILFESAADAFGRDLVGVLLTGANHDGAVGLNRIQESGGLALVQNPVTAQSRAMPEAGRASLSATIDQTLSLDEIARLLLRLKGDLRAPLDKKIGTATETKVL